MFKEYKYEVAGGFIRFEIKNDEAILTGFGQRPFEANIPDEIEGYPVRHVAKKALTGAKSLKRISLPSGVISIGDWAFASCNMLEQFEIREVENVQDIERGLKLFYNDSSLKRLKLFKDEDTCVLMAAAASMLGAEYLFSDEEHFFENWDAKLRSILYEADGDDFEFMILCGEEDLAADEKEHRLDKAKRKANLAFLRLISDKALTEQFRGELTEFLKSQTCGCECEAAFEVMLEHCEDVDYQRIFFELELVNDDNFNQVIEKLGDRYSELKAKIISMHKVAEDYFSSLEL